MPLSALLASMVAACPVQFDEPVEITQLVPEPSALTSADLNGDGALDVVGASSADGLVRVWFGDGVGAYAGATVLDAQLNSVSGIAAGDLDRDGDVDLALATIGPAVVWLENLGGGTFAPEIPLVGFGAPAPNSRVRLRVQDVDGDGWEDVLMSFDRSSAGQDSVVVLATGLGGGSFNTQTIISSADPLYDVEAGDLDGDGDMDIVVGNQGAAEWYRNDMGIWALPVAIGNPTLRSDEEVAILDLDDDGDLDVLSVEGAGAFYKGFYAILGDGAGGFVRSRIGEISGDVTDVLVGDVSGDGLADIVVSERQGGDVGPVMVARGLGAGVITDFDRVDFWESPVTVLGMLDADSDGAPEIAMGLEAGVILTRELDVAAATLAFAPGMVELTESSNSYLGLRRLVAAEDLNGDGLDDLLLAGGIERRIGWRAGREGGGFGKLEPIATFEYRIDFVVAGEFDGDGVLDLVYKDDLLPQPVVRFGLGDGSFGAPITLSGFPVSFRASRAEDIDGDGLCDLVRSRSLDGSILDWAVNLAGGSFGPLQTVPMGVDVIGETQFLDVTGDGLKDLTVLRADSAGPTAGLRVFPATAPGSFSSAPTEIPLFSPFEYGVTSGYRFVDLDQDDILDLVVSVNSRYSPYRNRLMVYGGLGPGQFGPVTVVAGTAQVAYDLEVVDLDLDDQPDLVLHHPFRPGELSGLLWYPGISPTQFAPRRPILETMANTTEWLLGDYDGDGDLDVVHTDRLDQPIFQVENLTRRDVGSPYCDGAVPNSTGDIATVVAIGSSVPLDNDLSLVARRLPPQTFGLFLTSQTTDAATVPNSVGVLCLGGFIGRFVGPGQVLSSGPTGVITLPVSPLALPGQGGMTAAMAGEQWHFQAWHRDTLSGQATSNFTRAVTVAFE